MTIEAGAKPGKALRIIRADILDRARRAAETGKRVVYKLKDSDREVITSAVHLIRDADSRYPFTCEGLLVALIRADRCATGWSYVWADASARAIVARALQIAGRRRPQDAEADKTKAWFTSLGSNCLNCGGELDCTGSQFFCSTECWMVSKGRLERRHLEENEIWITEASRVLVQKLKAPPAKCASPKCANTVHVNPRGDTRDRAGIFCSPRCAKEGRIDRVPERICENCGTPFRPHSRNSTQRTCGPKCRGELARKPREERVCARNGCDNRFFVAPGDDGRKFCCRVCANWRPPKPQPQCEWCGIPFTPKQARVRYCSREHAMLARRKQAA